MASWTCRAVAREVRGSERGATSVEFALLFPIFLAVCFGAISGGILFSDKLALTQGAREAARYGATLPYNASDPTSFLTEIRTAADDADFGQMGSGAPSYCVAFKTASGAAAAFYHLPDGASTAVSGPCPGTSGLPTGAHVLVEVTKPATLNMLLYRFDLGIGATSVARYEGTS